MENIQEMFYLSGIFTGFWNSCDGPLGLVANHFALSRYNKSIIHIYVYTSGSSIAFGPSFGGFTI